MKKGVRSVKYAPQEFRLEPLTDIDMLLMVEKGIRGEITQVVKCCAKANNKHMKDLKIPMKRAYVFSTWMQTTLWMVNGSKPTNTYIFMEEGKRLYL